MQGAGNDFVVLDETCGSWGLTPAHYRFLGDRHFGVGADQILTVRPAPTPDVDFEYVIHNADGQEVEQCGNGARCFARFVHAKGLTDKTTLRVQTRKGVIAPRLEADGQVTVDMGAPRCAPDEVPFQMHGLAWHAQGGWGQWALPLEVAPGQGGAGAATVLLAAVSMGNPHAVLQVAQVDDAPVATLGPLVQRSPRFAQGVNVGFMQVLDRGRVRLRVFERGVGETLACGSGACAAVVAGIRLGLLDARVQVQTRGGWLTIAWAGDGNGKGYADAVSGPAAVYMTGPAISVFEGAIDVPDDLTDAGAATQP